MSNMQVIGIDPGLIHTGWAVIEEDGPKIKYLGSGICKTGNKSDMASRLVSILEQLRSIIQKFKINSGAIEKAFVKNDPLAALKLGQARASAMIALGERKIEVSEYAPNYVKKIFTGRGHATKEEVERMASLQFPKVSFSRSDEADALAIALCHMHTLKLNSTLSNAIKKAT
ncbi:crossover junction endodeoxyribonuclease RuvC [Paracoccaceae bacterium]|nr:crossover junction endodeoxyribonuclease RuvC [Paracoccaceae bacterium]